jgi:hypothetical protein
MLGITLVFDSCMENKFYVKLVVEFHFDASIRAHAPLPGKPFHG